jgi:hypothetical protein
MAARDNELIWHAKSSCVVRGGSFVDRIDTAIKFPDTPGLTNNVQFVRDPEVLCTWELHWCVIVNSHIQRGAKIWKRAQACTQQSTSPPPVNRRRFRPNCAGSLQFKDVMIAERMCAWL